MSPDAPNPADTTVQPLSDSQAAAFPDADLVIALRLQRGADGQVSAQVADTRWYGSAAALPLAPAMLAAADGEPALESAAATAAAFPAGSRFCYWNGTRWICF